MLDDTRGKGPAHGPRTSSAPQAPASRMRRIRRDPVGGPAVARIVTPCRSRREFVATFAHLVDQSSIFILTEKPLPIGSRRRFFIVLAEGTIVMQGIGDVIATHDGTRGPAGMRLRFVELQPESEGVLQVLLAAKRAPAATAPSPSPTRATAPPSPVGAPGMATLQVQTRGSQRVVTVPDLRPVSSSVPPPIPRTRLAVGTQPGALVDARAVTPAAAAPVPVAAPPPPPPTDPAPLWLESPTISSTSISLRPPIDTATKVTLIGVVGLLLIAAIYALSGDSVAPLPAAVIDSRTEDRAGTDTATTRAPATDDTPPCGAVVAGQQ